MATARQIISNKQKNCNYRPQPVTVSHQKVVLAEIDSTEAIIKHTATTDEKLFLVARNTRNLTCLARTYITLHTGESVYFVATGRPGWYYIVNGNATEVTTPCTCVNGLNHEQCQHTEDAASYEARLAQEDEARRKEWEEVEIAECTAAVRSAKRRETAKTACLAEEAKAEAPATQPVRKARKSAKSVTILYAYVFKHLNRVCFTVLSDEGQKKVDRDEPITEDDKYNTCFSNGVGSCTCRGNTEFHLECYHIKQLKPVAAAKLVTVHAKVTDTRDKHLAAGALRADAIIAALAS